MPTLSPAREQQGTLKGLPLIHRGKVRDTYELSDDKRLIVTTDAISIFDFVLNRLMPGKGMLLNAFSLFWNRWLQDNLGISTHVIAAGAAIDQYLPEPLRGNPDLQSRAIVARSCTMAPIEFIVRGYLTGSGWRDYRQSRTVSGHRLPEGLTDGDQLIVPLDTPSSKAEEGHDEALEFDGVREEYWRQTITALSAYTAAAKYAAVHGIILADTKFEFSKDGTLCDEVLTPDSSRYWLLDEWKHRNGKSPNPYDKEEVRAAGLAVYMNELDPANPEHVCQVHAMEFPQEPLDRYLEKMRYLFWRLTDLRVEHFLEEEYGISMRPSQRRIKVVFGSESDLGTDGIADLLEEVADDLEGTKGNLSVNVISCHRNPEELVRWVESGCTNTDVVVACGGMALALPGVIKAWVDHFQLNVHVIGVALGTEGSQSRVDAVRSISGLPGQPVVMDEQIGATYEGCEGLRRALTRALYGELPPTVRNIPKPVRLNLDLTTL